MSVTFPAFHTHTGLGSQMEDRADDQSPSGESVAAGLPIAFDVHSCSMDFNILPAVSTFLVSESCVELSLGIVQRAFTYYYALGAFCAVRH